MRFGAAFGFGRRRRGGVTGGGIVGGGGLSAPVLAQTSAAGSSPFTWDEALPGDIYAGYRRRLQVASDAGFVTIEEDLYKTITEGETAGDVADWSTNAFNPPRDYATDVITDFVSWSGNGWLRMRYERDDGTVSAWSNVLTDNISSNQSTQWRLRISATQNGTYAGLAEIVFRTAIGNAGSAVAPTGVAASSTYSFDPVTYAAAHAIDGNNATGWFSDNDAFPHNLDFTFAAAIEAKEILITSMNGGNEGYAPSDFKLQRWNGAAYVDYLTVAGSSLWTANETRTFH